MAGLALGAFVIIGAGLWLLLSDELPGWVNGDVLMWVAVLLGAMVLIATIGAECSAHPQECTQNAR